SQTIGQDKMSAAGKPGASASGGRMAMEPSQPTGSRSGSPPPTTTNNSGRDGLPSARLGESNDEDKPQEAGQDGQAQGRQDASGKDVPASSRSSLDLRLGYPTEAFQSGMNLHPEDAIIVIVEGIQQRGSPLPARFLMQAEVPIGNIAAFLYKELGLKIGLQREGVGLDPHQTLLSLRVWPEVKLTAIHLAKRATSPNRGPATPPTEVNAVSLYFNFGGVPPDVQGVLVPCGATLKMVWEREFSDFRFVPRFLLDGERLSPSDVVGGIDFTDGVIIHVTSTLIGGGPPGASPTSLLDDYDTGEGDGFDLLDKQSRPVFFVPDEDGAGVQPAADSARSAPPPVGVGYSPRPVPIFPSDLTFYGDRPEDFFAEFEHRCKINRIPRSEWFANLRSRLCKEGPHDIRSFAENLPEWEAKDYDGVKAELISNFSDGNVDKFVVTDLTSFVDKRHVIRDTAELNRYIIGFKTIANYLLKGGLVTDIYCRDLFLKGLPEATLDKLEKMDLEPRQVGQPSFKQVEADVRETFKPRTFYARFRQLKQQEEDRIKNPERIKTPNLIAGTRSPEKNRADEKMGKLTELMSTLTLNVNRMLDRGPDFKKGNYGQHSRPNTTQSTYPHSATASANPTGPQGPVPTTVYQGDPSRRATAPAGAPTGPAFNDRACYYCRQSGHGMRECTAKQKHLADGIIKQGPDGKIKCADGGNLPWEPGLMQQIAQQRYEAWRSSANQDAANSHLNHFEYVPTDGDDSEHEYMPLEDEPLFASTNVQHYQCVTAEVLDELTADVNNAEKRKAASAAAERSKKKGRTIVGDKGATQAVPTGPPPQLQHPMDEDEDDEDDLSEEETPDQPTPSPTSTKRAPPQSWHLSPVQEQFSAVKAVERILEQSVPVPLKDALGMNADLRKVMMGHLKSRRVARIGPRVHFAGNTALASDGPTEPFYTHSLPIIDITSPHIQGRILKALVDTGSEIDMVSPDVVRAARVPVRKDGKHRVVGINNQPEKLSGLVEGFQLTVGGISAQLHVWIRDCLGYDVLIGMPGIRQWGMTIKMKGEQGHIEMVGPDGVRVKIQALRLEDPRNRQFLPPNLGRHRLVPASDSEDSSSA
ncbi:hypothetical protein OC834_007103, partial [Tilletia horrida]